MKSVSIFALAVTLAGCGAQTPRTSSTVAPSAETQALVAECWQRAGLEGDLYRIYNPERFGVLTSAGNASQAQLDLFNACVGATA